MLTCSVSGGKKQERKIVCQRRRHPIQMPAASLVISQAVHKAGRVTAFYTLSWLTEFRRRKEGRKEGRSSRCGWMVGHNVGEGR